jgi:RHS repeat-associated protein
MHFTKYLKYGPVLFVCLAVNSVQVRAASRHSCDDSAIDFSAITAMHNNIADSPDCSGPGDTTGYHTATYVIPGCRSCVHTLSFDFGGNLEVARIGGPQPDGFLTAPEFFGVGVAPGGDLSSVEGYWVWNGGPASPTDTCDYVPFDHWQTTINYRGGDYLILAYYLADDLDHHGLTDWINSVSELTNYDDGGDIVFDVASLPADGVSKAHARVTNPFAFPPDVLTWQIDGGTNVEQTLGCTINPQTGEITAGKISGTITVRAFCSDTTSCWIEEDLKIGCSTCQSGCVNGNVSVGSVLISVNAGNTDFGRSSAGLFHIDQAYPSAALSTPAVLQYCNGGLTTNDVTVVQSNGIVQQVYAPQISANVVSNSPYQYQILFYTNSTLSGTPVTTWTFLNPDGATSSNRLDVTELTEGLTNEYDYVWDSALNGWTLTSEGGSKIEKRYSVTNGLIRTEMYLITDGSSNIKFQETNIYQTFSWGEQQIQQSIGSGTNALVTTWDYYTNAVDTTNYGRLYQVIGPGNHWERYAYDTNGVVVRKVTQYLDNPLPTGTAEENNNRVTLYDYYADSDGYESDETTTYLVGAQTSWVKRHHVGNETIQTEEQTPDPSYDSSYYLTNYTWVNLTEPFIGEPSAVLNADGTMSFYTYILSSDGNYETNIVATGQPDGSQSYIVDGTETITVLNQSGNQISQQVYDIVSGLLTSSATTLATDTRGRPTQVQYLDGTTETTVYGCCGVESFTDREGITTTYNYDPYTQQPVSVTRAGITTLYAHDAAGNLIQTTRVGTDNSQIIQNVSTYDDARRLTSSTPADNGSGLNQTTYYSEYYDANVHLVKTTTYPDDGTRVETYYQDGSLLSVTGTAVYPVQYLYGLDTRPYQYGEVTEEIKLGSNGQQTEWTEAYRDSLGRNFLTFYAGAISIPYTYSYYNNIGQLYAQQDQDELLTYYFYNGKGEQEYVGIDMDGDGSINAGTVDRLTQTVSDVTTDHGTTVLRRQTFVWPIDNDPTAQLAQTTETSADGLNSWSTIWNNGAPVTSQTATVYAGGGTRYVTNAVPDGSYTVSVYQNDLLASVTSKDSAGNQIGQVTYGYDAHGRQTTVTDTRNGATTYFYNNADQISGTTTPSPDGVQSGEVTTNYFESMGRIWKTTLPDNTSVTNVYYPNGLLAKTYGSRTYPVGYGYDSQGRMTTMTNWTSFASGAGVRVTTWNYDPYRGFLTGKVYDGGNPGPSYTYTAAGRLQTRTWARGTTATYGYDLAGELNSVTYSDSTPPISYGYDRLGRQTAITNGTAVCSLAYDLAGDLLSESYSGGPLDGLSVTNGYDQYLRRTALAALSSATPLLQQSFGYDNASRLASVSDGTNSAGYTYVANSPLVSQIMFTNNGVLRMTTAKSYDYLNRLTAIQNSAGAASVASFNYHYNTADQRTAVTNADNSYWVYQFDSLGQVISGKKYWNDGTPVAGQQFNYAFDDIGNRQSTASGGDQYGANLRYASYTVNNLNQYTSRTVPGYVNILGSATNNATVTVNLQPTYRHEDYFRAELNFNNASAALYPSFTNVAVLNNGTNDDIIATNTGNLFIAQTPEQFSHDADGNLVSDGRWTNTWDGENRLLTQTSLANAPTASKRKVDLAYDWQGRRIQKIVSTNNGSAYVAVSTNKFIYDGWNLVGILDGGNNLLYSFQWDSDAKGIMQKVGGGALISMTVYSGTNVGTYFYVYDGNNNVEALVNAATGAIGEQYEYGPFGNLLRVTGPLASINPFLFSTKFYDWETGLYYYGYRYYDPSTGRWLNRDPQTESGGLNLYEFAGNDPIDGIDLLGQDSFTIVGKSFINGFGDSGDLGWRFGAPVPAPPPFNLLSVKPWFANARLAVFRQLASPLPAFNQNPSDASEDGKYRLYARRTVNICFDGSKLNASVTDSAQDGGTEFTPLISGTIDSSKRFENNTGSSVEFVMRAWGHPNWKAEYGPLGMQWVAIRTSVNIWYEARIRFSSDNGKITYNVMSFTGSHYPSRRLWVDNGYFNNGQPDSRYDQGSISSLWNADPSNPTFVAP